MDGATIILEYPGAQGIIQASWNWPFNRKDMHVYGVNGYIFADDGYTGRQRSRGQDERPFRAPALDGMRQGPFAYLARVVRGSIDPDGSLAYLEVDMTAMEILVAVIRSARFGQTIYFFE